MTQKISQWIYSVSFSVMAWVFACSAVFAGESVTFTVHIQEVFDGKVSLTPFEGARAVNPIAEVPNVKNGENAVIKIPAQYLPGEFVLRIDYRAQESDNPYPAERIVYINKQDVEIFINPPYSNNDEKTRFNKGEAENTVYSAFMKENSVKRAPIDLLRQFLLSYDMSESKFYKQAVEEFEVRRTEYNKWLKNQSKKYHKLYISSLFQFQHVPAMEWAGNEDEHRNQMIQNYFEGIDFNDTLIIRSREMSRFMDVYMGLYGMQAKTEELRDSLFTEAGRVACEKASKGAPKVYGWMVDYFYKGYETHHIDKGMAMLERHINNSNCLTSKKQQIIARLEGMAKLIPGAVAPDFTISDNQGNSFEFYKWKSNARHKLLLFWSSDCESCRELVNKLADWHNKPVNKEKLDIAAINLDETEAGIEKQKTVIFTTPEWNHFYVKEGVNSSIARDYAILSTPVMFLIGAEDNIIVSCPRDAEQLIKDLNGDEKADAQVDSAPAPIFIYDKTPQKTEAVFFSKESCSQCDHTQADLYRLQVNYPEFSFTKFNIERPESVLFYEYLGEKLNIPKDKVFLTPAIVIGNVFLAGKENTTYSEIEKYVREYRFEEKISPYNTFSSEIQENGKTLLKDRLINKIMNFAVLPIVGAGLIDGINPCAFSVIIFFVTCLWAVKKEKKYVLAVGMVFIIAVFLTYFSIGVGAIEALNFLLLMPIFKKIMFFVYIVIGAVLFILAYLSLTDFVNCIKGNKSKIFLKLTDSQKMKIQQIISKHLRLPRVIAGVSLAAFLVSVTELACTGQVYLPIILYVLKVEHLRLRAVSFLLLYNIAFIIPLIVVFIVSFFGFKSYKLARISEKNLALGKLLLFLCFLGLALLFSFQILRPLLVASE